MDRITYKGKPTLLIDTADLIDRSQISHQEKDVLDMIKKYDIKGIIVITSLPIQSIPLWLRRMGLENIEFSQANCYRWELK